MLRKFANAHGEHFPNLASRLPETTEAASIFRRTQRAFGVEPHFIVNLVKSRQCVSFHSEWPYRTTLQT